MLAKPRTSNVALQDIMRAAMPVLAEQWDGELDRVAFVADGEPIGFITRAAAIEYVTHSAADYVDDGGRVAREKLEAGLAPNRVDLILEGWGGSGVMRISTRDLARYLSGDFESPAPAGSAEIMTACADPEIASAMIGHAAERLPP